MGWFDNTVPKTFQTTAELPIPGFKRIRLVLASSATEPVAVGGASLASMANTTDINASSVTHFKATFDGKESGVIPASPTAWRRSYLFSDWIDLASEERNDGGQRPVVVGRVFIPTSGQISVLGNGGSDDYRNWSDRRDGALWAMRFQDGNCCGGTGRPETFASSIPQTQSPIAGFVFETKRGEKICTISGFGDSITEGRGTYINAGWGVPMCEKLGANFPDVSFSWANMGWSGQGVTEFVNHQSDAFAADLVPDVCFFPNGSPNTAAIDGEVTDPRLQTMADRCADMQSRCLEENIPFVIWTWLPTDPVVPNMKWGASDAKRIAYNLATLAEGPKRGFAVADFSAALAGPQDSAGQTLPRQGAMVDGVHPSDAGNAELKDIGAAAAVAALARAAG